MSLCSSPSSGINLRLTLEPSDDSADAGLTSSEAFLIVDAIVCVVIRVARRVILHARDS